MATYNGEKFIEEQIRSILKQTHSHWTLYIHDDNSIDSTLNIIKQYRDRYPTKIILIEDDICFGNPTGNFSHIITSITNTYDYYMFSDQDDYWLSSKIEDTLIKMLDISLCHSQSLMKLVHTDLIVSDSALNIISESMWKYQKIDYRETRTEGLLAQNNVTGCTVMFDRNVKQQLFPIPKEALMHDWWLAVNVSKYGEIGYVNRVTLYYRQHSGNSVGAKKMDFIYYLRKIRNISKVISHYKRVYVMIQKLDFPVSFFNVMFLKFRYILRRIKDR